MSAFKVTDKVLRGIEEGETDVFIVNFANPDMVGHTGKLDKTIEACQYVDLAWVGSRSAMRQARGVTIITRTTATPNNDRSAGRRATYSADDQPVRCT